MTRSTVPSCRGQRCESCKVGFYWVVNSTTDEELKRRIRYFGCRSCGHRPKANKWVVSLDDSPSRKRAA